MQYTGMRVRMKSVKKTIMTHRDCLTGRALLFSRVAV